MKLVKTNVPGYKKDMKTNVLHNINESAIENAKIARKAWRDKKNAEARILSLEERIARLEYLLRK